MLTLPSLFNGNVAAHNVGTKRKIVPDLPHIRMLAAAIVTLFSGLSAASSGAHHSVKGMLAMLSACRFLLGIGIGAEYPCGSVAASEQSEESGVAKAAQHRWFALATNSMIDFGFVVAAFVPLVLFWIFGENHLRAVFRLSLGLGMIPALAVFIWRLKMDEPAHFKKNSMARAPTPYLLILRRYWKEWLGISLTWFIYDFITLFYMPGTLIGAFVVDILGPKYTMIFGLLCQAVIGFIMSGLYVQLTNHIGAFAVVYGIFLSFGELGPGNCLGLLAAKTGPTAVRGQFYGIAAAVGKIGAFVGTWTFKSIIADFGGSATTKGNTGPFWIGSALAILSALITLVLIRPISHDGMADEDLKFRVYLEEHGYDTSQMGLVDDQSSIDEKRSASIDAQDVKVV
ncbi:hypothetical protein PHLCEN_2v4965 [Hermanssonia centrifuga]|uniref:Major facilitator superfamily (MFS) profile domain-containing protein n=1 Tax=Hermanssonia centrifuga TaxID=98765 RepID=A0A2R6PCC8_9APHY|nr:hypothetical protein PHLCEN_2v4965 [Hermanssonia centrifuga]